MENTDEKNEINKIIDELKAVREKLLQKKIELSPESDIEQEQEQEQEQEHFFNEDLKRIYNGAINNNTN